MSVVDRQSSFYRLTEERSTETAVPWTIVVLACLCIPLLLAYYLSTTNELRVVAVLLGVIGLALILIRPYIGLILFTVLLYLRPEENIAGIEGLRLPLLISLATLAGWVLHLLLRREKPLPLPSAFLIITFGLWTILGGMGRSGISLAANDVGKLVLFYLLIVNLVRTPGQYQGFISTIVVLTFYVAVRSIQIYFSGNSSFIDHEGTVRSEYTGIFADPNDLAALLVGGLPLILGRLISGKTLQKFAYGGLIGIVAWAIFLTHSRGGMLALLIVVGSVFLIFSRNRLLAFVLAGAVCFLLLTFGTGRMTNFDSQEESANSRFHFWINAVEQLRENPVVGVGYRFFADTNDNMVAHNTFVQCFAETGLPGYFFWIGCLYYCFRRRNAAGVEWVQGKEPAASRDILIARLATIGFFSACFWISRTFIPITYLFLALPVATQVAYIAPGQQRALYPPLRGQDIWRIFGLSLASIILIWRFAVANV